MLQLAYGYEEEINKLLYPTWYDPKYMFYNYGCYREPFSLNMQNGDWEERDFVSVNGNGEIIGMINYGINRSNDICNGFGAINFTDDMITFGRDLAQVIDDVFCKFNHRKMSWSVVCGNPIEKSYDKYCKQYGGRIIGVRRQEVKLMDNKFYDQKYYEMFREEYLRGKQAARSHLKLKDVQKIISENEYDYGEEECVIDKLKVVLDKACIVIPELHLVIREGIVLDAIGNYDYDICVVFYENGNTVLHWEQSDILTTLANMHIKDYTKNKLAVTRCYICREEDLIR